MTSSPNNSEKKFMSLSMPNENEAILLDAAFSDEENIFAKSAERTSNPISEKRLNALDTQLIEKRNILDSQAATSAIDYKINELTRAIEKIEEKIDFAKMTDNELLLKDLNIEKFKLTNELEQIKNTTNPLVQNSPLKKIVKNTAKIVCKYKKQNKIKKISILDFIFGTLLKPFTKYVGLKEIIDKLENLNESVDELAHLRIPYGERECRYEELTKYLSS